MAWLETKGDVYRIRFRFGGSKHLLALHTSSKKEANESLARFEANLRLIERGIIDSPPQSADVGVIISGGKLESRPSETARSERPTLGMLFDRYLEAFPKSAKEASTWKTETIHIGHLKRLLDGRINRNQLLAVGCDVLGEPWAQSHRDDKKPSWVDQLDRAFSNPEKSGRTPDQIENLKSWLPNGMSFGLDAAPKPGKVKKSKKVA